MSRQLRFFATTEDMHAMELIFKKCHAAFINKFAPAPTPILLDTILPFSYPGPGWLEPCLTHQDFMNSIVFRDSKARGYWILDVHLSPIIELARCVQAPQELRVGRLWYESSYYDENQRLAQKSSQFIEWAKTIFRSVKNFLVFDRALNAYIGPGARSWQSKVSGRFVFF